ncbi:hypothetical protein IAU60_000911 [Kwoniella sp. DSM 27419]
MVYDPIRDCDVPSSSPTVAERDPWRNATPVRGGAYEHERTPDGRPMHPHQSASYSPPPPGSGGLRGLLNETPSLSRRGSDRTASVSSLPEEPDEPFGRAPVARLLSSASTQLVAKSNSNASLPRSSPSNPSPGSRHHLLDPNGFLTPATPASAYPRSRSGASRSPHPQTSPPKGSVGLPQAYHGQETPGYPVQYGEPSQRRESVGTGMAYASRPMPPPQHPVHSQEAYGTYDYDRRTPSGTYQHLPQRSPSASLSPRSQQQSLPYSSSRPGSSGYQHSHSVQVSPAAATRRLSEDQARPMSSGSASGARRYTDAPSHIPIPQPTRPSSQASATPYSAPRMTPMMSPSPVTPQSLPYAPNRQTQPGNILQPIDPEEAAYYREKAQLNNPLRRRIARRPLPSWSGPSPGPRGSLPAESDSSYFPPHVEDDRSYRRSQSYVDERGSAGRPSVTPTPGSAYGAAQHAYPPAFDGAPAAGASGESSRSNSLTRGRGNGNGSSSHLKRPNERDDGDYGHEVQRRKVSGQQYVGNVAAVANHYNSRPEVGVEGREFSPIIGLKKFNNWIKSVLIGKFAHRPRGKVLDLGCGKGGDLNKWKQARISLYVGMDLADTSIQQAAERYQRLRAHFDGYFFAFDCFSKPISAILPEQLQVRDLYDNVSMQFCMHYAFESPSKARMMIENVSRHLRKGGVFMGTIPNADLLLEKLNALPEDDEELRFGNSCYYVQFAERRHKGIYGHQYHFFLTDAVEDVPEYVVDWENFEALAMEYRLRLVYKKPFHDVLQEEKETRDFGPLLGKMGVVNEYGESAMDEDQWEAANLYMAFAFEKI